MVTQKSKATNSTSKNKKWLKPIFTFKPKDYAINEGKFHNISTQGSFLSKQGSFVNHDACFKKEDAVEFKYYLEQEINKADERVNLKIAAALKKAMPILLTQITDHMKN